MNFTRSTTRAALISSSCGNFQKHVLVSHNESFSDCHGWIVRGNDNFDANLLIIHWRNPRLPRPGKKRVLSTNAPCNQWSPIAAPRIIWLGPGQLVHKNGTSRHILVNQQLWMTLLLQCNIRFSARGAVTINATLLHLGRWYPKEGPFGPITWFEMVLKYL